MYMKMEQLQYVLEIEKCKSMSKASENLFITQQNLSYSIKKLEDELNIPILKRYNKGCELTEEGQLFSVFCRNVLQEWEDFQKKSSHLHEHESSIHGELHLYINKVYEIFILPDILGGFMQKYPNIKIKTIPTDANEGETIDKQENFVWLLNLPRTAKQILYEPFLDEDKFDFHTLFTGKNVLCVNKENPLSDKKNIHLKTALQYPLIYHGMMTINKDALNNTLLSLIINHYGDYDINIAAQTNSYGIWLDLIASGKGIGITYDKILNHMKEMYPKQWSKISVISTKEYMGMTTGYAVRKSGTTKIENVFIDYLVNNCTW